MFGWLWKKRVHEPLAVGALLGASASFHTMWILNLLRYRVPSLDETLLIAPSVGSVSGIYAAGVATYALVFGVVVLWLRGRDCSDIRDRVFWFYVVSTAVFVVMTIPVVFAFKIQAG
jgi:hypothetical protein